MFRIMFVTFFTVNLGISMISASFLLEELKSINYEVDIVKTPVKVNEDESLPTLRVKSKYGQTYQCLLPQIEDDESLDKKDMLVEETIDVNELLKPIKIGACLLKTKDWWTYEFCFGHYIKQYHIDDGKIIGQVITLGLYESDYDWNNETDEEKFRHVKQRYHSQIYSNGSRCDLTGLPRNAEVRFYCEEDSGDYIYRVDEPGTCSYILTIHTSRLCSHPRLKPLPSTKARLISCSPLLNEEQYALYLQKLDEEKTVAENERTKWLSNQQERLKVLKSWSKDSLIGEAPQSKMYQTATEYENDGDIITEPIVVGSAAVNEDYGEKKTTALTSSLDDFNLPSDDDMYEKILQEYDREIEKLKSAVPPQQLTSVKSNIEKQLDYIISEADEELGRNLVDESDDTTFSRIASSLKPLLEILEQAEEDIVKAEEVAEKIDDETKHAMFTDLASTLITLLEKLDKAEKDVARVAQHLRKTSVSGMNSNEILGVSDKNIEDDSDKDDGKGNNVQSVLDNFKSEYRPESGSLKVVGSDQAQSAVLDDDKLHVRIRRLDKKSLDATGELHEMDLAQRTKLEQAIKEKLEKSGVDTGGRRIEVKIITAGYYDNEDGKDFHTLSDDETIQFQNMIMALLTGQQEAIQEMERHKKLEENYKFVWNSNEQLQTDDDDDDE